MLQDILIQTLGVVACFVQVFAYYFFKNPRHVLIAQSVASIVWSIHFYLLGVGLLSIFALSIGFRNIIVSRIKQKYLDIFLAGWALFVVTAVYNLAVIPSDYLVILCIFVGVSLCKLRDHKVEFFGIALMGAVAWFTMHVFNGSTAGMVNETFMIFSTLFALIRAIKNEFQQKIYGFTFTTFFKLRSLTVRA